jgi:hypothetical protein
MSLIRSKSGRALAPICACILKVVLDLLLQVFRLFLPAQQWWYKLLGCADTRSDMIWELKKWQYSKPQGVKQVTDTQNPSTYVQVSFHKRVGGANSTGSIYWRQMKVDATGKLMGQFPFHCRIPAACLFQNKRGNSETSLF